MHAWKAVVSKASAMEWMCMAGAEKKLQTLVDHSAHFRCF